MWWGEVGVLGEWNLFGRASTGSHEGCGKLSCKVTLKRTFLCTLELRLGAEAHGRPKWPAAPGSGWSGWRWAQDRLAEVVMGVVWLTSEDISRKSLFLKGLEQINVLSIPSLHLHSHCRTQHPHRTPCILSPLAAPSHVSPFQSTLHTGGMLLKGKCADSSPAQTATRG